MRHVTLRQLRTFTTALRAGSFAAAAETLHITPPAVTVQMRDLEKIAGMPIVERTPKGMRATDAGREVLTAAARIEEALAECDDALASLRGLDSGRVAVGVVSTAKYFAPQVLGAFARAHPAVEIRLEVGNRAAILAALEANTLDLALTGWPPGKLAVQRAAIGDHPHIIIARPDHAHAGRQGVSATTLAHETFLVREPGSGTRLLMERLFAEARVTPRIGMEMGSNETIKQAVIAGLGIAFISAHTVAVELADGRLVALDVVGLPVMRTWFIVNLAKKRLLPSAQALRQFMIDEGQSFLPAFPATAAAPQRITTSRTAGSKRKSRRPRVRPRGGGD
jgi:LysR family transcriptional regulator, low CO2-responsive transcriptional regulator